MHITSRRLDHDNPRSLVTAEQPSAPAVAVAAPVEATRRSEPGHPSTEPGYPSTDPGYPSTKRQPRVEKAAIPVLPFQCVFEEAA
eukprot:5479872-Pyramimonas_sp.AAC.1